MSKKLSLEDMLREASITEVHERKLESIKKWLDRAIPGSIFSYFTGGPLPLQPVTVWQLKVMFWELALEGKVILLHKKFDNYTYQYLAQIPRYKPLDPRLIPEDYKQR